MSWQFILALIPPSVVVALILYYLKWRADKIQALKREVYEPLLNDVNAILDALPLWEQVTLNVWKKEAAIGTKLKNADKDLFAKMNTFYENVNGFNSHIAIYKMKRELKGFAVPTAGIEETAKTIEEKIALLNKLGAELISKLQKKM